MVAYSDESIAEMNIYENLVNLARIAEDVLRIYNEIIDNLSSDTDLIRVYNKISEPRGRVEENKVLFMEYLARVGETLPYKQNYASIALGIERFTQLLDGASYRLALLRSKKMNIDEEICGYLKEFKNIINEQYNSFINALRKIRVDPKITLKNVTNISKLENRADEIYRSATFALYTKLSNQILLLMMLKDIFDFIENTSDLIKSIGEELRYLALHKIVLT